MVNGFVKNEKFISRDSLVSLKSRVVDPDPDWIRIK
jgi:hypothetical protein